MGFFAVHWGAARLSRAADGFDAGEVHGREDRTEGPGVGESGSSQWVCRAVSDYNG